jgi:predicted PurR-regulated permease PerM
MVLLPEARAMRLAAFVIALTALAVALFLAAPLIWSVVQIFIIAGLLSLALEMPVRWLTRRRMRRWVAVALVVGAMLLLLALLLLFLIPALLGQFAALVAGLPALWASVVHRAAPLLQRYPTLASEQFVLNLISGVGSWALAARSVFATAVGAATATVLIVVITVYTLLNPHPLLYGVRGLFPSDWWPTLDRLAHSIAARIRRWVMGTLLLSLIIGLLVYLGLHILNWIHPPGLPFVLVFAIFAALLEIVPIVGPIIAAVVPALVGFSIDPWLGAAILLLFFVVQQIENHLAAPLILQRAVRQHPVSLIFALVVLSGLFGLFGALIAVPVSSALKVLYDEWYYPLMHDHAPPPPPAGE